MNNAVLFEGLRSCPTANSQLPTPNSQLPTPNSQLQTANSLQVVGAVLRRGGRYLLGKRALGKSNAGLWEFIGGKVESGESLEEALVRECREELALDIFVHGVRASVTHEYPDRIVHLTLLDCEPAEGSEPKALEHESIGWFLPSELSALPLSAADAQLLKYVVASHGA